VPGRIIDLTVSIITITGIKGAGVPRGTKWAILWLNCLTRLKAILPSHRGRARDKVNLKCLEEVKTYGVRPRKLFATINMKRLTKKSKVPGLIKTPKTALNSEISPEMIIRQILKYWLLISQYL
jgi:hypothetical protein